MAMNILVVEDERNLGRSMEKLLTREGHEVALAEDGEHGWNLVQQLDPQFVILDCRLPNLLGIELLQRIRKLNPDIYVVMMTAYGTIEAAVEAMRLGAFDFLEKPIDMDRLTLIVGRAEGFDRSNGHRGGPRNSESASQHQGLGPGGAPRYGITIGHRGIAPGDNRRG